MNWVEKKTFKLDSSVSKGLSIFNPPWHYARYFRYRTMAGISGWKGPQKVHFVTFTMGLLLHVQCMLLCKPGSIFIKLFLLATPNNEALNSADKHRLLCWYKETPNPPAPFPLRQIPINACIPKLTSVVWEANGFTPGWVLMQLKLVTCLSISSFCCSSDGWVCSQLA